MFLFVKRVIGKANYFVFNYTPAGEIITSIHSLFLHLRYSFNDRNPGREKDALEYYLVKHCHIVEKGLALPEPRKAFGRPKITTLIKRTREYEKYYSESLISLMVRDTLRAYVKFHADCPGALSGDFLETIENFIEEKSERATGGLKRLIKSEMVTLGADQFAEFVKCRHSIRSFSSIPVEDSEILKALHISRHTPSVCNRQGWLVHYYKDKAKIQEILSYQNGNAGFSDCIDKLLIITCSARAFTRYEHNQLFVDGGLYAMSLMLALHSAGLGACPLNTCMPWLKENRMKKVAGINQHERVIMMIAVGNLLDSFYVAQSEKYPIEKFLRQH